MPSLLLKFSNSLCYGPAVGWAGPSRTFLQACSASSRRSPLRIVAHHSQGMCHPLPSLPKANIIARTYSQPVRIPRHTYVTDHITTSHFSSMRTSSSSLCLLLPGCEWASIFDLLIVTRILHGNNQHCTRARLLFSLLCSVVHQGPCSS